ncbi:MAG: hypothetical protein ABIR26_00675 [Ramlibacter sp.]
MKLKLALLCAVGLASANAMACYTVYDRNDRVLYQGETAPVDMSRPLHETLGRSYPGAQMVFDQAESCSSVIIGRQASARATAPVTIATRAVPATNTMGAGPSTKVMGAAPSTNVMGSAPARATRSAATSAPLLTDRRTAMSLQLPYTVMSGEIVMVRPEEAARVVQRPGVTVVPKGTIGAISQVSTASPSRSDTVITELHNPPMTVVSSNGVIVSAR